MPAAAAIIPSVIGLGTSLIGGAMGSGASKQAAQIQSAAATKQAEDFKAMLAQYNPQIGAAGTAAAGAVNDATAAGQTQIGNAVTGGQQGIGSAVTAGQALLQPYIGAGGQSLSTLMSGLAPGGDLNKQFTAADMQQYDPGYAFRIAQANKAMAGSAAARGGALGGGTMQAMAGLNQNLASSEFANAEQRFRAQQTDRFNRLNSLVNLGASSATTAGGYGMTGANEAANLGLTGATSSADLGYRGATTAGGFTTDAAQQQARNALATQGDIANLMTGGANAQAAGVVGSSNAWSGALGGFANAANQVGGYYQGQQTMKDLMANPAMGYIVNPRTGRGYQQ